MKQVFEHIEKETKEIVYSKKVDVEDITHSEWLL